jgi:hypothetical protein
MVCSLRHPGPSPRRFLPRRGLPSRVLRPSPRSGLLHDCDSAKGS